MKQAVNPMERTGDVPDLFLVLGANLFVLLLLAMCSAAYTILF